MQYIISNIIQRNHSEHANMEIYFSNSPHAHNLIMRCDKDKMNLILWLTDNFSLFYNRMLHRKVTKIYRRRGRGLLNFQRPEMNPINKVIPSHDSGSFDEMIYTTLNKVEAYLRKSQNCLLEEETKRNRRSPKNIVKTRLCNFYFSFQKLKQE